MKKILLSVLIAVSAVFMSNAQALGGRNLPAQKPSVTPQALAGRFDYAFFDYNVVGNMLEIVFDRSIHEGVVTLTSLDTGASRQTNFSYWRPVNRVLVPGPSYGGWWEIRVESPECNFLSLVFNVDWLLPVHVDLP